MVTNKYTFLSFLKRREHFLVNMPIKSLEIDLLADNFTVVITIFFYYFIVIYLTHKVFVSINFRNYLCTGSFLYLSYWKETEKLKMN